MKRYWKVILNEAVKFIAGSLLVYAAYNVYTNPLNPDSKTVGLICCVLGLTGLLLLVDLIPSLWAIYKGTHKLLPHPLSSKSSPLNPSTSTNTLDKRQKSLILSYITD